ncbi:YjbH domain-containing protein [Limnobacter sp. MED105]|uniref:YjbH domain-containing protein n=1 Tax=Limnobacter sp. MED105 TaxID=391597 RepID=UPI000156C600|nr:YjbH domain-containing protein [Limnobacter sp. MED105]EDM85050.1 otnG protein [Limnobacter sp. MED105]
MKPIRIPFVLTVVAALVSMAFMPAIAVAASPNIEALQAKPQGTERLSALLVRQGWLPGLHAAEYRLSSLLVLAPSSADAIEQQMARDRAIQNLRLANRNNTALQQVLQRVGAMPVNGRLKLESTDANYLQARPEFDPVLNSTYTVVLPQATNTVTVLSDLGTCVVPHQATASAQAYIEACIGKQSAWKSWLGVERPMDWAWVANPNGTVEQLAVNGWNEQAQGGPAPGSWLWAPSRKVEGEQKQHEAIAGFLATQGEFVQAVQAPQAHSVVAIEQKTLLPEFDEAEPKPLETSEPWYLSSSDWGVVGLLQTPTARMRQAGSYSATFSRTSPYSRYSFMLQPFDWMEAGFRYNSLTNAKFGVSTTNPDQSFKDKNFDVKFRLMQESAHLPELSVGFRDVAGTGLFSGEYVVGSKRVGSVDFSLGIGWGSLGAGGGITNPFKAFGDSFETRPVGFVGGDSGGTVDTNTFFKGPAALFGGAQVQLPWEDWVLKLEVEGNDYQSEPFGNNLEQSTNVNVGLLHRVNDYMDFTLGYERGTEVMVALSFHEKLDTFGTPKLSDPPSPKVNEAPPTGPVSWPAVLEELKQQTGWVATKVQGDEGELKLIIDEADAGYWQYTIDRATAVLHKHAPAEYAWFNYEYQAKGQKVSQHIVDRNLWVRQRTTLLPNAWRDMPATKQRERVKYPYQTLFDNPQSPWKTSVSAGYRQILGGPDGFILYQLSALGNVSYELTESTVASGRVRAALLDNFDKFTYTAPSNLPRVRTFQREYATTSDFTIPNLQLTHYGKLGSDVFYTTYGGLLEDMFAGVGGEVLYRPMNSTVAIGVDVNSVKQRDFEQDFGLRDYQVNTGHATLYWDTGFEDILVKASVGQYLAGDKGATMDLSRVFDNGVKMGAFFTRTNVSAAEFGEGSFDKGVYVTLPFDAFFTQSVAGTANLVFNPLTRDGGAKLSRSVELYDFTQARDPRLLTYTNPAAK